MRSPILIGAIAGAAFGALILLTDLPHALMIAGCTALGALLGGVGQVVARLPLDLNGALHALVAPRDSP